MPIDTARCPSYAVVTMPRCFFTKLWKNRLAAALLFTLGACNPVLSSEESLFTSIKSEDCHKPSAAISGLYEERGLTAEECAAAKDWRLFVASSDERSWLELARDDHVLWSTEEQVVYRNTFGYFPNIGAEKVEWRMAKTKLPTALIFRIAAQNPQHTDKNISRLFVIGFRDNTPFFCGVVKTNQEARVLAEQAAACSINLQVKRIKK